jgi:O-antigen/teichoic acid export membrane protein
MISFIKIYLWQILSLVTGFGTLFIVTPFLSTDAFIFGIFSVVTALTMFFSYADLGFLSAGIKYVSEEIAKENKQEEITIVGFVTSILAVFVLVIAITTFVISFKPEILITGLPNEHAVNIASELLLIFSVSAPLFVMQRSLQLVFNARLKDYLFQRLLTLFNIIKIASVYYFFANGKYDIIGYYIFGQICLLSAIVLGLFVMRRNFDYSLRAYFGAIRFTRRIYDKTKSLAYGSLMLTIGWILFYELDLFVIGKFIGAREVAIFSICLTVMTFLRSIYGIIYNPFTAKLNHYVGKNEMSTFNEALRSLLIIGLPFTALPPIIMFFTMDNFILAWVGQDYLQVIPLISVLILSYIFAFISNPSGIALIAQIKIKDLYWTSIMMPGIFWPSILIGYQFFGLGIFAWSKFLIFFIMAVYYAILIHKYFEFDVKRFVLDNLIPFLIVIAVVYIVARWNAHNMPVKKGKSELFSYVINIACYYLFGIMLSFLLIKPFRLTIRRLLSTLNLKLR